MTKTAARRIAAGYSTEGGAVTLGSVMVDGVADPAAAVALPLSMVNRHGLIAGATGTGKTKTLQLFIEQLSASGVPVVVADIKGDLSGLAAPGEPGEAVADRATRTGIDWAPEAYPVQFVSLGTEGIGVPVRATISGFGPILLSKVLGLNATQESTLGLIFHWADQQGLELFDLKDLRSVIRHLTSDEGKADLKDIGGVSTATAGVILRALVNLEAAGGDTFFGDPELDPADFMRTEGGRGVVTAVELGDQSTRPALFSTFLMWILAELFQTLPEKGDVDRPELVFIFDEAHLLFADASKAFLEQVVQTVKLIRSKGVGVYFCSQQPSDIPKDVLSQLGARIQHSLRVFTPEDQAALARTVRTYPKSDVYDIASALTSLGTGEAIVTVLSERGAPTPVAWTLMTPPRSLMDTIGAAAIAEQARGSALYGKYGATVDPVSAFEKLAEKARAAEQSGLEAQAAADAAGRQAELARAEAREHAQQQARAGGGVGDVAADGAGEGAGRGEESFVDRAMANPAVRSFLRSAASAAGREISRNIFGTRSRRRR
ncbi:helicase HerA-like domain-containing protein [Rhodococcus sp. IEGM 1408]|uniref:helicase HerA-like domain-containing protein n=1 Tax=Rhodococcus sp. IEGM 1408 TaxID=3082220 RepID=UPI002954BDDA|nr:helicase HerA-like domain-containing protein [Rhodococcus sp. IEGM 1408]MDV8000783.1 helicase HerA-like domain-containing protein [Rhodococcus sp. IEGM 1408]